MAGVGPVFAILMMASTPGGGSALGSAAAEAARPEAKARAKQAAKALPPPAEIGRKWGIVTSTKRSPERNRAVGGAANSFHLYGRAIDIARRPGVRHADIDAAYRKAGFRLIESLDEGDHSHFAFAIPGHGPAVPATAKPAQLASADPEEATCAAPAAAAAALNIRRRPDRGDGCPAPDEPAPRLRPIQPTQ